MYLPVSCSSCYYSHQMRGTFRNNAKVLHETIFFVKIMFDFSACVDPELM